MDLTDRAILRRAKNFWRRSSQELFAQVPLGFEDVALHEITDIGLSGIATPGGVTVPLGSPQDLYVLAMASRCATRILLRISEFPAHNYPMLYNHTKRIPWEALLGRNPDISIKVTSSQSRLRHMAHIASVICDGISDRMSSFGLGVVHRSGAQPRIYVRMHRDRCTLSLDTTGEPLYKRGYRTRSVPAPIRENVAACLLREVQVTGFDVVVDPFCGSGTFPIEAAGLTRGLAASAARSFAIEKTPLCLSGAKAEAARIVAQFARGSSQRVTGFDRSRSAIDAATRSSRLAGVPDIVFAEANALEIDYSKLKSTNERGLVVANLPYGKRLSTPTGARSTAREFARRLAETATGWNFLIISPVEEAAQSPGLNLLHRRQFLNGGLPVIAATGLVG